MSALTTVLEKTRKHSQILMGGTGALIIATTLIATNYSPPSYTYPSDTTYPITTSSTPPVPPSTNTSLPTVQPSKPLNAQPLSATPHSSDFGSVPLQLRNILQSPLFMVHTVLLLVFGGMISITRFTFHPVLIFGLILAILPNLVP